jgi:chloramphenicol 3-O-phosphotransferase
LVRHLKERGDGVAIAIVITGPSSVGKSTLVSGLQAVSAVPLLRFGVDELYRMVPADWAGGTRRARYGERGFRYAADPDNGPGAQRIVNGVEALDMLRAHHAGVTGMLSAGHHVIVDGEAYEPALSREFHRDILSLQVRGVQASFIGLRAAAEALTERQERHAHPAGLALGQAAVEGAFEDADLVLDTTQLPADAVLDRVRRWLSSRHPLAFAVEAGADTSSVDVRSQ